MGRIAATTIDMQAASSDLLWLMQLASPALPVGGYSYSEGLEAAVEHGLVHDEASAQTWLQDQLHLVHNAWVMQTRETFEIRLQTEQMGRSLLDWLRNHTDVDTERLSTCQQLPPTWPLVFALALTTRAVAARDGLLTTAFAWAENMVQAAIKSVPLGQRSGQRILAALSAEIPSAVDHAMSLNDDQRQAFSPRLAILSARHETQYSRLFRS
ncbi:MAG: urease accessory protein UreF [Betaproteobacteria bacterium]|nr:urease accessory protein UreF [Betaproteobacteria bacterium]